MELALIAFLLAALVGAGFLLFRSRREESRAREESVAATVAAKTRADHLESRLSEEKQRADNAEQESRAARDSESDIRARNSRLQAELQAARDSGAEKIQLLRQAREEMARQFENLAQEILEKKGAAFDAGAREKLADIVKPLAADLKSFRERSDAIHTERARESADLLRQVTELQKGANRVAEDANNLTRALKGDKKALGDWGETTLERLLEESGLRRGSEYAAQDEEVDEDGKRRRPDFKILLPEGRHLIVDSKASLVAYHAYVSARDDAGREKALSEHVAAVRSHAKGLGEKHYQRGRAVNSPDFVFMFMPIEAAWMAALLASERLFDDSYDRKVILVARTTLLPTLKTVAQLWKFERQTREARESFDLAGKMVDKFSALLEEMHKIDRALAAARKVHGDAMRKLEGRDNLLDQARRLVNMGANAKRKPPERILGGDSD